MGLVVAAALLGALAPSAAGSGPPVVGGTWASAVQSSTARLSAEVIPNGLASSYHFDYITQAAYAANLNASKEGFSGASRAPAGADANLGSGSIPVTVQQLLSVLQPSVAYRYRVVAKNAEGTTTGASFAFSTQGTGGVALLPDSRGWEMVSPVEKNGGQVAQPGTIAGGGVLHAAASGDSVTYGSTASFASGAQGAPPASQYLSRRGVDGWMTGNITVPIVSGSFGIEDEGVPYQLFSGDLARGLLLNGEHCRDSAGGCAVANPPLAGTDAPAGYQNYYSRDTASGLFEALLGDSDIAGLSLGPADFDLRLTGGSPDLRHLVLSTCASLTADATEIPLGTGCDPLAQNLYGWTSGAALTLLNILPAQSLGHPRAVLAAQSLAVSSDGSRVYWSDLATGNLYLRAGSQTKQVDAAAGGAGVFQTASADGSIAFFTKAGHLWRYSAATEAAADLTPAGGVEGVLGTSGDGSRVYYLSAAGLFLWDGATTEVAATADASNYPPTTGTARLSDDGAKLLFLASASLTGYDNTDLNSGEADSQIYLYDAPTAQLRCLSCNPTGGRPIGPSTIPGAIANGTAAGSIDSYKPRAMVANGRRVFFDSDDSLVLTDTNKDTDVYQWETQGEGSCARPGGCLSLISSGRSTDGASFVDAATDGDDAFFLTDGSLVAGDPGGVDLYDARIGGGFPVAPTPIACQGDLCQAVPPVPVDPTLTTLQPGAGNPPVSYKKFGKHRKKHRKHGKRNSGKRGAKSQGRQRGAR